jgi:hypothetical protein
MTHPEYLTKPVPKNFDEMVAMMLRCEQTPGQSVYQHGQSVCKHVFDLIDHINGLYTLPEDRWRLPEWLDVYGVDLVANLHDEGKIRQYTTYHDCGKPYCRTVDKKTGDVHFQNHVDASSYIWACVGGNQIVGHLISQDMVIHTETAEQIAKKLVDEWTTEDAATLLLVSLAELHSNARMFGGVESVSFKIKWKQLERRGKQICKHCFGDKKCVILKAS